MTPTDLLAAATTLLESSNGQPTEACCRRAASSVYYAIFHCLARTCADLLIGEEGSDRSPEAWLQVYRALEHAAAKDRCKDRELIRQFPGGIQDFAGVFVTLQDRRHRADYDPTAAFPKVSVEADVRSARRSLQDFEAVGAKDRRAFCAYVLLKRRN